MRLWEWFVITWLGKGESEICLSSIESKLQTLESHVVEKTSAPAIQFQGSYLLDEIIKQIFATFVAGFLQQPSLESVNLKFLRQAAQVCKQWQNIAEHYFLKIYKHLMSEEDKPSDMTSGRMLCLLYNWKHQKTKKTYIETSQPVSREFIPLDCHSSLEHPALTFDRIEVKGI